ncbi:MAG: SulP family inorganic anion transporter [Deinococcota bacterium]
MTSNHSSGSPDIPEQAQPETQPQQARASSSLGRWRAELAGGLAATIIGLPKNIAYGLIAFAPLGALFVSEGIMVGFVAAIVGGGLAALLGGTPALISGPSPAAALVFASVLQQLSAVAPQFASELSPEAYTTVMIVVGFLVMALAGLWQVMFGFFRLGNLIKFTPYPVIAGLLNGLALLVLLNELGNLVSLTGAFPFIILQWERTLLALLVTAIALFGGRVVRGLPSVLVALVVGSGVYYGLRYGGLLLGMRWTNAELRLGGRLGDIGSLRLSPRYFTDIWQVLSLNGMLDIFSFVITAALSVALLASTKTLLAALNVQNLSRRRSNVNRELMAQGVANIVAAGFGGIASEGSFGQSVGNYQAGGRTRLSGVAWSLLTLVGIYLFGPLIGLIPDAVVSGLLIYVALTMTDRWSLSLLVNVVRRPRQRQVFLADSLVIVLVTLVTIATNLTTGVATGVLVSIVVFVIKMSKAIVRRRYDGSSRHSKKQRDERALDVLTEHGNAIHVIELEGSLFFASADALALELDTLAGLGVGAIILDMKRLQDIDLSSVRVLEQAHARLGDSSCQLALSYARANTLVEQTLESGGLFASLPEHACFTDTDAALEYFEDSLLKHKAPQISSRVELDLADVPIFSGLRKAEFEVLHNLLHRQHYTKGQRIVHQGAPGDAMFVITRGLADVILEIPDSGRSKRLSSLAAGTFFGELALLDQSPRSANIDATQYLVCYRLDATDFERLQSSHPAISMKLLTNISRTLTTRLRYANETISELEV